MGAHIHELKGVIPLDITMVSSAWRDTGNITLPLNGRFSFFQNETADAEGWFDTPIRITHEENMVTVEFPHEVLRVKGLDGSLRSLKNYLNLKQRNLRGVHLWFSPTRNDTWHITPEED